MSINVMPFWASVIALVSAQLLKPLSYYLINRKVDLKVIKDSGGFPSSHSALVSALTTSVGLTIGFSSPVFAITASFSMIIIYDAANVRYYSGRNIEVTHQLVQDFQEETNYKYDKPIYHIKLKDVLGHRWVEVFGGIILGVFIAMLLYYVL